MTGVEGKPGKQRETEHWKQGITNDGEEVQEWRGEHTNSGGKQSKRCYIKPRKYMKHKYNVQRAGLSGEGKPLLSCSEPASWVQNQTLLRTNTWGGPGF